MPLGVPWCKHPSQAFFMISLQSFFFVHISLKWNLCFREGYTAMESTINKAQWSEVESTKWRVLIPLK